MAKGNNAIGGVASPMAGVMARPPGLMNAPGNGIGLAALQAGQAPGNPLPFNAPPPAIAPTNLQAILSNIGGGATPAPAPTPANFMPQPMPVPTGPAPQVGPSNTEGIAKKMAARK